LWIPTLSDKILKSKNSKLRFAECRAENTALHHPGGATTPYALYTHPKRLTLPAMGTCCTSTRTKHDRLPFHACMPSSNDQCICCARSSKELPTVAPPGSERARWTLASRASRSQGPKARDHLGVCRSWGKRDTGRQYTQTAFRHAHAITCALRTLFPSETATAHKSARGHAQSEMQILLVAKAVHGHSVQARRLVARIGTALR